MATNKVLLVLLSLLIAAVVFILMFWIIYGIAITVSPAVFIESDGTEHPTMPMGQAFLGLLVASVSGIISFVVCFIKIVNKKK